MLFIFLQYSAFSIATTRALLHKHFSLSLPHIPTLCPPVPNRYFFVRWIQHHLIPLVENPIYFQSVQSQISCFSGIDLGTGATCIYPLLFCAPSVDIEDHISGKEWKWFASEVDPVSTDMAIKNVRANHLESKIQVVPVPPTDAQMKESQSTGDNMECDDHGDASSINSGPIVRLLETLPQQSPKPSEVTVIMTNPPFHESDSPIVTEPNRSGDQRARTALTEGEASYPGGEVNFLIDNIVDSIRLSSHPSRTNVQSTSSSQESTRLNATWHSSMFGKKKSWIRIVHILTYMLGPARVQSTEFGPGNLTRWFVSWTYRRPNVRSPLALYQDGHTADDHNQNKSSSKAKHAHTLSFEITFDQDKRVDSGDSLVSQVVDRVVIYCQSIPGYRLKIESAAETGGALDIAQVVTIQEEKPMVVEWDERKLPSAVLQVLRTRNISFMDFLPQEGHFVIDISIRRQSEKSATIGMKGYLHSEYGKRTFEKIKSQLQPEVCRTNRRWRRVLQRDQQHTEQQSMET